MRKGKQGSNHRDQTAACGANPHLGEQQQGGSGGDQTPRVSEPYTPTWQEMKLWATARYQVGVRRGPGAGIARGILEGCHLAAETGRQHVELTLNHEMKTHASNLHVVAIS